MEFFGKNCGKWQRLSELVNGFQGTAKNILEAKNAFDLAYPKNAISSITFSKILDVLPQEPFTYLSLLDSLRNNDIKMSDTTLKYYIRILQDNNIVSLEEKLGATKVFKYNQNGDEWKVQKR